MRVAIMQPYFLPYAGYFQLITATDRFVLCDDFQYTRHGWMTRNRFLRDEKDVLFSLPIKSDSQNTQIREREIAEDFTGSKLLNQLHNAYRKARFFSQTMPLLEHILQFKNRNLSTFLENSINQVCRHLQIKTPHGKTSELAINPTLKKADRVIALCLSMGAKEYVNSIGGQALYSKERFERHNIKLSFLDSKPFVYRQFGSSFVGSLSILDAMMFNSTHSIRSYLETDYELV